MDKLHTLSLFGSLGLLLTVIELVRAQKIKEAYALLWIITSLIFLVFSIKRSWLDYLGGFLGFYYPPAFLFLFLIVSIIMILIQFSVTISGHNEKIKKLAQELALLKLELSGQSKEDSVRKSHSSDR